MLYTITEKMTGAVSVVDDRCRLVGLVTDYDVRKTIEQSGNLFSKKIPDIMNPKPTAIHSYTKAVTALKVMENREKPITLLPVVDNYNKVIGMVHLHDILAQGI